MFCQTEKHSLNFIIIIIIIIIIIVIIIIIIIFFVCSLWIINVSF